MHIIEDPKPSHIFRTAFMTFHGAGFRNHQTPLNRNAADNILAAERNAGSALPVVIQRHSLITPKTDAAEVLAW